MTFLAMASGLCFWVMCTGGVGNFSSPRPFEVAVWHGESTLMSEVLPHVGSRRFWILRPLMASAPVRCLAASLALAIVVARFTSPWHAALSLALSVLVFRWWRQQRTIRARIVHRNASTEVLSLLEREVRTGASLVQAIQHLATAAPKSHRGTVRRVVESQRVMGIDVALREWEAAATTMQCDEVAHAARSLRLATTLGSPVADVLRDLADQSRRRVQMSAETVSLATQARSSAWLMGLAPMAFAAVCSVVDQRVARFLFSTSQGALVLMIGVALELVGLKWMATISKTGSRP